MPAALLLPLLAAAPPPPEGLYERVVSRAIEVEQEALHAEVDLWEDHSTWENAWEVASAHFVVRTTESRFLAQDVAQGLETMLGHFQRVLGTTWTPTQPQRVWIFPALADYNAYGNANGAEHSSMYGSYFANGTPELAVATMYTQNGTQLRMWITHSALHQFIAGAFPGAAQTAVSEGLAGYFSLYWDPSYAASEHERVAKGGEFVPLQQLFQDPIQSYVGEAHDRFMELGTLFTYLLHYREDTRLVDGEDQPDASFAAWLRATLRGQDASGLGFQRLLEDDLPELEESFRAFSFPR